MGPEGPPEHRLPLEMFECEEGTERLSTALASWVAGDQWSVLID